jgi:small subunit ribosomal protein S18
VVMTTPTAPASSGTRPAPRRRPGEYSSGGAGGGRKFTPRRKVCQFCVDKIKEVDYKDLVRLRRFLSERGKIEPRRKTGTCAAHQRSLNVALKRARQLAMLPFTAEHIRVTGVLVREPGAPPFRGARPRPPEFEGAPEAEAAAPETPPDGQAAPPPDGQAVPPPSTESPEPVAESPSAEGVRETAATGPSAEEA